MSQPFWANVWKDGTATYWPQLGQQTSRRHTQGVQKTSRPVTIAGEFILYIDISTIRTVNYCGIVPFPGGQDSLSAQGGPWSNQVKHCCCPEETERALRQEAQRTGTYQVGTKVDCTYWRLLTTHEFLWTTRVDRTHKPLQYTSSKPYQKRDYCCDVYPLSSSNFCM